MSKTVAFVRRRGDGPAVLLLHGFPQTHLMWHRVAPGLAERFTVVCADLPGYGASRPGAAHRGSKRAMATLRVMEMEALGIDQFTAVGHDRGGRVAYRMALDQADRVERLVVLDIVTTLDAFDRADDRMAVAYWPWWLLAQPAPLPESLLIAAPDAIVDNALGQWGSAPDTFPPDVRAATSSTSPTTSVTGGPPHHRDAGSPHRHGWRRSVRSLSWLQHRPTS